MSLRSGVDVKYTVFDLRTRMFRSRSWLPCKGLGDSDTFVLHLMSEHDLSLAGFRAHIDG